METIDQSKPAHGLRTFFTIWSGQLVSLLGSQLTGFALGVWVYEQTHSVLMLALAQVAIEVAMQQEGFMARSRDRLSADRARLATAGDQGRDLVRVWRGVLDLDRDGASALLGGGDCDDLDSSRYPGARDIPGDGIDQDCDGVDAVRAPDPPPVVTPIEATTDALDFPTLLAYVDDLRVRRDRRRP